MTTTIAAPAGIEELRARAAGLLAHDTWTRERLLAHPRERRLATRRHAVTASPD